MADNSPLAGLVDRAGHVLHLAWELGRAFRDEYDQQGDGPRTADPTAWNRHQPAFNEFCTALLEMRDVMQNPPRGFEPVAEVLMEATNVARQIRGLMLTSEGKNWQNFLSFRFQLDSIAAKGGEAVSDVRKAQRLDDPFAFVEEVERTRDPAVPLKNKFTLRMLLNWADGTRRANENARRASDHARTIGTVSAHLNASYSSAFGAYTGRIPFSEPGYDRLLALARRDEGTDITPELVRRWMGRLEIDSRLPNERVAAMELEVAADSLCSATAMPTVDSANRGPLALVRLYTNGLSDERLEKAAQIIEAADLNVNEKLTRMDAILPLPPIASAEQLGDMLGVTKQAVLKTSWWIQNRKGEKADEIGRRRAVQQKRAKEYESPGREDD